MTTEVDVQSKIERIFSTGMNVDVPSPDTDLFEAGVLDSLHFVELIMKLEEEFGWKVELQDLQIADFRSIGTISRLVSSNGRRG